MIPHTGQVGDHRQVKVKGAAQEINPDAGEVPQERRHVTSPDEGVEDPLGAAHINPNLEQTQDKRKEGNSLGDTRDGASPLGLGHAQNGRDERTGVADANEEHEVREINAPIDRPTQPGDSQAQRPLADQEDRAPQEHQAQNSNDQIKLHRRVAQRIKNGPL